MTDCEKQLHCECFLFKCITLVIVKNWEVVKSILFTWKHRVKSNFVFQSDKGRVFQRWNDELENNLCSQHCSFV